MAKAWKHPKPVIGLLGGIGAGKSAVAKMFASLGCGVISADALSQAALDDPQVVATLARWWGAGVAGPDGRADRKAIAAVVFADPAQRERLEGLIHPRVHAGRAEARRRYFADPAVRAVVEDTPLLLEKGLRDQCDVLVFVAASQAAREARVAARGWDREELAKREKTQWPLDRKAALADYVVDNNGGDVETLLHVRRVLSQILNQPV